jgi:FkbH-like protein
MMNTKQVQKSYKRAKIFLEEGKVEDAFTHLCSCLEGYDDFPFLHRCANLYKKISKEIIALKPIKIALLATSTVDQFTYVLQLFLAKEGFDAEFFISEFDTVHQTVLDTDSELYTFNPDIVWIFNNFRDLKIDVQPGSTAWEVEEKIQENVNQFKVLWVTLKQNSTAYIIQNNMDIPLERVFGNFEGNPPWGKTNFYRAFNSAIAKSVSSGITIFDMEYISSLFGKAQWFDDRYWYHSKHAMTMDSIGCVAFHASKLIGAIKGKAKKCIVLDLDNTLWGGVIGDDGIQGIKLGGNSPDGEAFSDFQKYLKKLKERGIILTICSKNEEKNAKIPFEQHPDMQLSLDDIIVFKANWNNKADNIIDIADILEIDLNSMVFLDDNPMERDLVKTMLPMVAVPDLPEDPCLYTQTLNRQLFFETVAFSTEDKSRSDMYKGNVRRKKGKAEFTNISDYLKNLNMHAFVGRFDALHLPRVTQLINKSNQFNLTTKKYTEAQIQSMMENSENICRYFKLKDRFGDNGLISLFILEKQDNSCLLIDTWVMSCRVFARGMEEFVFNELITIAQEINCNKILGKFIPTKKNNIVKDFYKKLGFSLLDNSLGTTLWELKINQENSKKKVHIDRKII